MTANDLLDVIGYARAEYVLAADAPVEKRRLPHRKLLLIAAIVAVGLLLAGCVAVFLRFQDMSVGKETYTQKFDDQGYYIDPVEKTADIVSLYGSADSTIQKAAREWYAYWETLVPEDEIPEEELLDPWAGAVDPYRCYTQEMRDKVKEIADKYGLKLLEDEMLFQRWQWNIAREAWGVENLLRPDAQAKLSEGAGDLIPPRNIHVETTLRLTGEDAVWKKEVMVSYRYDRTDYMPTFNIYSMNLDEYRQWSHTAPDGTQLLLGLDNKGQGLILAEGKDAVITITVRSYTATQFPDPEDVIQEKALEQIADTFDYKIQPGVIDVEAIRPAMEEADQKNKEAMLEIGRYGSFQEYLRLRPNLKDWYYSFYDLDGNGEKELLLGNNASGFCFYLIMHDGKAEERMWACDLHLLQNGGFYTTGSTEFPERDSDEKYYDFYAPLPSGYPLAFDFSGNKSGTETGDAIIGLQYKDGNWVTYHHGEIGHTEISEAEAQAIIDQYPEIELEWWPLREYPMDENGKPLEEVWREMDIRLSPEELRQKYAQIIADGPNRYKDVTHYALEDMNGDGVDDLILSYRDGEYLSALTWRYSMERPLSYSFSYYCGDGVYASVGLHRMEDRSEATCYEFYRIREFHLEHLEKALYHKATDQWMHYDEAYTPMPKAEGEAILAQYPEKKLDFRPIAELTQ